MGRFQEWRVCWALICGLLPISQLAANPPYLYSKGRSEKAETWLEFHQTRGISNCLAYNASAGETGTFAGGKEDNGEVSNRMSNRVRVERVRACGLEPDFCCMSISHPLPILAL